MPDNRPLIFRFKDKFTFELRDESEKYVVPARSKSATPDNESEEYVVPVRPLSTEPDIDTNNFPRKIITAEKPKNQAAKPMIPVHAKPIAPKVNPPDSEGWQLVKGKGNRKAEPTPQSPIQNKSTVPVVDTKTEAPKSVAVIQEAQPTPVILTAEAILNEAIVNRDAIKMNEIMAQHKFDNSYIIQQLLLSYESAHKTNTKKGKKSPKNIPLSNKETTFIEGVSINILTCCIVLDSNNLATEYKLALLKKLHQYPAEEFAYFDAIFNFVDNFIDPLEASAENKDFWARKFSAKIQTQSKIQKNVLILHDLINEPTINILLLPYAIKSYIAKFIAAKSGHPTDKFNNNFLHALFQHDDPQQVLAALQILFVQDYGYHLILAFFEKNLATDSPHECKRIGSSPLLLLDAKPHEWHGITMLCHKRIVGYFAMQKKNFALSTITKSFCEDVYNNNEKNNLISHLFNNQDFVQLSNIVQTRCKLRNDISAVIQDPHKKIFGENEFVSTYVTFPKGGPYEHLSLLNAVLYEQTKGPATSHLEKMPEFTLAAKGQPLTINFYWWVVLKNLCKADNTPHAESAIKKLKDFCKKYSIDANLVVHNECVLYDALLSESSAALKFVFQTFDAKVDDHALCLAMTSESGERLQIIDCITERYYECKLESTLDILQAIAGYHSQLEVLESTIARSKKIDPGVLINLLTGAQKEDISGFKYLVAEYNKRAGGNVVPLSMICNQEGNTLLHLAAYNLSSPARMRVLIQNGCDFSQKYAPFQSILPSRLLESVIVDHQVELKPAILLVKTCLDSPYKEFLLNYRDVNGYNLLAFAIPCSIAVVTVIDEKILFSFIKELIELGADLNYVNLDSMNIFHSISVCLRPAIPEFIIDKVKEKHPLQLNDMINKLDHKGNTPLDLAIENYNKYKAVMDTSIIDKFVALGCKRNTTLARNRPTP